MLGLLARFEDDRVWTVHLPAAALPPAGFKCLAPNPCSKHAFLNPEHEVLLLQCLDTDTMLRPALPWPTSPCLQEELDQAAADLEAAQARLMALETEKGLLQAKLAAASGADDAAAAVVRLLDLACLNLGVVILIHNTLRIAPHWYLNDGMYRGRESDGRMQALCLLKGLRL